MSYAINSTMKSKVILTVIHVGSILATRVFSSIDDFKIPISCSNIDKTPTSQSTKKAVQYSLAYTGCYCAICRITTLREKAKKVKHNFLPFSLFNGSARM